MIYFKKAAKGFFSAGTVLDLVDRFDLDSRLSDLRVAADKAAKAGNAAEAAIKMWGGAANADQVPDAFAGRILADRKEDGKDHPAAKETFEDRNDKGKKA